MVLFNNSTDKKMRKQKISKEIRNNVITRDNGRCRCCGCPDVENLEIDHIVAESNNGENSLENFQALCGYCNKQKHNIEIKFSVKTCLKYDAKWSDIAEEMRISRDRLVLEIKKIKLETEYKLEKMAQNWIIENVKLLTIRKRLEKQTTKGIVEKIIQKVSKI